MANKHRFVTKYYNYNDAEGAGAYYHCAEYTDAYIKLELHLHVCKIFSRPTIILTFGTEPDLLAFTIKYGHIHG